ncbi:MAG: diadenylate cyclase CdaA [Pseudomonadota bacterium]
MYDVISNLFQNFRLVDVIDIIILAFAIYWMLTIIKGTKAVYMLIGLGFGFIGVWLSSIEGLELYAANWILKVFFANLPLIIIVLFQHEIRRALTQIGRRPFFSSITSYARGSVIEEVVKASANLSGKNVGALIVIEKQADLTDHLETGVLIDSNVTKDLIVSIFMPNSPIHDGAIIIQKDRIAKAGCFLPLTMDPRVSKEIGSRHRAAIGLTEEVDAVVVVVSEETGTISVVIDGKMTKNLDSGTERTILQNYLMPKKKAKKR